MNDETFRQDVRLAMDSCLSGVCADSHLTQKILCEDRQKHVKSRIPLSLAFAVVLITVVAAALAVGIYETIKPAMDQSAHLLLDDHWGLENKLRFVEILETYGLLDANDEQLSICRNPSVSDDRREQAASALIDRLYGDLIQTDPSILQQEETMLPNLESVFTVFYHSVEPEADPEEISEAFDRWFEDSELFSSPDEEADTQPLTEAEILALCNDRLSEIYNLNRAERAATHITAHFDAESQLWVVQYTVKSNALRQALREEWHGKNDTENQELYEWSEILLPDGQSTGATSIAQYQFSSLIPREGYPDWERWESDYRAFLYCSTESRAAFSSTYKPLVDQFLEQHPEVEAYYRSEDDLNTVYITTRHMYGIPDSSSIDESQAIDSAIAAWMASGAEGVWPEMLSDERSICTLYDVTDPDKPVWKVSLDYYYEVEPDPHANKDGYFVILDAKTGEILAQYIKTGPNGVNQYCDSALDYAETFL